LQQNSIYWGALKEVMDPEFPISVVDMGLIYDIVQKNNSCVIVKMTYTTTACPCMQWIEEDIKKRLLEEKDVTDVEIQVIWDPPWTVERLSDDGRKILQEWGISSIERAREQSNV
jgi:metal-sulfur cluster biosynthetic enzyme